MIKDIMSNKKIRRLILVNSITLARLPMIAIFVYELISFLETGRSVYGLNSMIISILILISDFIDGRLARKYDVVTKAGQNLDIYLDLTYILAATGVLVSYGKIDLFYIMVIIYKFLEFVVLSKLFKGNFESSKGTEYYYDLLGTISSGLYYIVPLIVISLMYFESIYMNIIVECIVIAAVLMTGMASVIKIREIVYGVKNKYYAE